MINDLTAVVLVLVSISSPGIPIKTSPVYHIYMKKLFFIDSSRAVP